MLNNQKLTANRETVIKTAAMVAVAALMFGLILVFNSMIGYAAYRRIFSCSFSLFSTNPSLIFSILCFLCCLGC